MAYNDTARSHYKTELSGLKEAGLLKEERFIHAPSSGGEVRVESLRADYWSRRYNGARRVITPPG